MMMKMPLSVWSRVHSPKKQSPRSFRANQRWRRNSSTTYTASINFSPTLRLTWLTRRLSNLRHRNTFWNWPSRSRSCSTRRLTCTRRLRSHIWRKKHLVCRYGGGFWIFGRPPPHPLLVLTENVQKMSKKVHRCWKMMKKSTPGLGGGEGTFFWGVHSS